MCGSAGRQYREAIRSGGVVNLRKIHLPRDNEFARKALTGSKLHKPTANHPSALGAESSNLEDGKP
jgi:hypothetical protein